jgi:Ca2+-binding RTX toxin-like protein
MAIIIGTTNSDTIINGVGSAGVTIVDPPAGQPFAGKEDLILGLAGDDRVLGGLGDDTAFLDDGDDLFGWDPGDGSDTVSGGRGTDTLGFNGSDAVEQFTISDTARGVQLFRDVGDILMDLNGIERIELNGLGGDDLIDASALTQPIELIVNGGRGDDTAVLGPGADRFIWNPGDGDDTVDGRAGTDTLEFNGSDAVEEFTVSDGATGGVELFRDVGNILMDLTNIEKIELNGLGGDDLIDASALTRPVDLIVNGGRGDDTAVLGPGADRFIWNPGDGDDTVDGGPGTDTLEFNGSDGAEEFVISDTATGGVELFRSIGNILMDLTDIERIELNSLGGADRVDATSLSRTTSLVIDTGAGDDVVTSGPADDTIAAGAGSDVVLGGGGADRFVFGTETADGVSDFDTIGDYKKADGDVVDLSAVGAPVDAAAQPGGLLLTLDGGDGDRLFLANVNDLADVTLVA